MNLKTLMQYIQEGRNLPGFEERSSEAKPQFETGKVCGDAAAAAGFRFFNGDTERFRQAWEKHGSEAHLMPTRCFYHCVVGMQFEHADILTHESGYGPGSFARMKIDEILDAFRKWPEAR